MDITINSAITQTTNRQFGFSFAESVKTKQATSSSGSPGRAIDLRTTHSWFTTNNAVQEEKLKIELDGEFHIVMIYIVGKNLIQFKLELGKFVKRQS